MEDVDLTTVDVLLGDPIMDKVTVQIISVHIKVVAGFPTTIKVVAVLITILAVDLDDKDTAAKVVFNKEETTVIVVTIKDVEMLVAVVLDKAEEMATTIDAETMVDAEITADAETTAVLISSKTITIWKTIRLSRNMIKAVSTTTMPNRTALQSMMASSRMRTMVMKLNTKKIITWTTLVSVMIHTDFQ